MFPRQSFTPAVSLPPWTPNSYPAARSTSHWIQTYQGPKRSCWLTPLPATVHKDTLPRKERGLKSSPLCWLQLNRPRGAAFFSCPQKLHNANWGPAHDLPSTLNLSPHCLSILVHESPSFHWPGFNILAWGILDHSVSQFLSKSRRTDLQNISRPQTRLTTSTLPPWP